VVMNFRRGLHGRIFIWASPRPPKTWSGPLWAGPYEAPEVVGSDPRSEWKSTPLAIHNKAQLTHSKMAVSRHLGIYRTANSAIRSADPENRSLESTWSGSDALFARYSPLNYTVTLKLRFGVTQGHRKWHHPLAFGAPVWGEAVSFTQRPLVTKN